MKDVHAIIDSGSSSSSSSSSSPLFSSCSQCCCCHAALATVSGASRTRHLSGGMCSITPHSPPSSSCSSLLAVGSLTGGLHRRRHASGSTSVPGGGGNGGGGGMRRCVVSCPRDMRRCCTTLGGGACCPPEVVRTDVIIIGNGPSAISLSHLLSGHWPYYRGGKGDEEGGGGEGTELPSDESLCSRLAQMNPKISFVQQDLKFLSDGLEGRSSNPVSLLFDALANPDADLGVELPSLFRWEFDQSRAVSHVVLGRKNAGGLWQTMDGEMQTLSLGSWMQLADMSFRKWLAADRKMNEDCNVVLPPLTPTSNRATFDEVRRYYADYVASKGLSCYFKNYSTVTSVQRVTSRRGVRVRGGSGRGSGGRGAARVDSESGEQDCCVGSCAGSAVEQDINMAADGSVSSSFSADRPMYVVNGYRTIHYDESTATLPHIEEFCYVAPSIVLATGAFDRPNLLRVPGETIYPYVTHSLAELEARCLVTEEVVEEERDGGAEVEGEARCLRSDSDPVLVVGAGLCAADAVIHLMRLDIPVVHVFRRDVSGESVYRQLPANIYPEYHAIYRLMLGEEVDEGAVGTGGYTPYSEHDVVEFTSNNEVLLRSIRTGGQTAVRVTYVLVLIGARPDLSFLAPDLLQSLGVVHDAPIMSKHNPVDVDPYSYESNRFPGLYAMGPLVGDNFVRFLRGGALAITADLWRKRLDELVEGGNGEP